MRTTTNWALPVPNSNADPDSVPAHMGALADAIDLIIAKHGHGTLAARPLPGHVNSWYFVDSGPGIGILWFDNGVDWVKETPTAGLTADITTASFGDAPNAGASTNFAPADHRHGQPANPVTAHVAASNPHPQYALAASIGAYAEKLIALGNMGATPQLDLSLGNAFKGTMNANAALSIANVPATAGVRISISLEILQDGTGGRVMTWPASWKWGTAGAPALSAAGKADFVSAYSDNNGGLWKAFMGSQGGF